MQNWMLALILQPLAVVCLIWIAAKIKSYIYNNMQNGWLKDQLLRERWHSSASKSHWRITRGQKSFK
jgi:hypothetical protein